MREAASPIRDVLIIGGGTAGWMTAAQLARYFGPILRIRLIESDRIPTIGVGEATFNTIKSFFDSLGLSEADWMPECGATYKVAIRFVNWNGQGSHFYHPFERSPVIDGVPLAEWWLRLRPGMLSFDYACFSTSHICDVGRSPRFFDGTLFDENPVYHPYAYHFDAGRLARFLRDYAVRIGVSRIDADVVGATVTPDGAIASVNTNDGSDFTADLYIDCSGFRGLLINEALAEPFISFRNSLLCDRAVAGRIYRPVPGHDVRPYTTAMALSAGWLWDIPLFEATGAGYVYCSTFLDEEQAEREFRESVGLPSAEVPLRHLRIRVGRTRRAWVKNCVSIGLSAGFIEPLESTGIFLIQHGIASLIHHFPTGLYNEGLIHNYNRVVTDCIEGVRDFLILHYYMSGRTDTPFWQAVHDINLPDSLEERLNLWRRRFPTADSVPPAYHGFAAYSYAVMLAGLGHPPSEWHPIVDGRDPERAMAMFHAISERSTLLQTRLPSHGAYLRHLYGISEGIATDRSFDIRGAVQ